MSQEKMQNLVAKEERRYYSHMLYSCFKECIKSMSSQKLLPAESICLENCFQKNFASFQRQTQALNYASTARMQNKP